MARVYLARLRGLGGFEKRLVVKQILPHLANEPRFVSMFVEEAKTLVQMSHPHIVPVYELGIVDGVYFLAMEHVEGATLHEILEDGPVEPAQAAHIGAQICEALSYAHERFAIVHRDVTPRNIMIDSTGHCRLLDFGIAAPVEWDAQGAVFGTPGYLSPEQARGDAIAPASDLFALGAVLHHALTGTPVFDAQDRSGVLALVQTNEAPRLELHGIDEELASIIRPALAVDPSKRPESARVFGRALRGWVAAHEPAGVGQELGLRSESARQRREERRLSALPEIDGTAASTQAQVGTRVSTLAQSRALSDIMAGTIPLERPRDSSPNTSSAPSTPVSTPSVVAEARPDAEETARIKHADASSPETHPTRPTNAGQPSSRTRSLAIGAASLAVFALFLFAARAPSTTLTHESAAHVPPHSSAEPSSDPTAVSPETSPEPEAPTADQHAIVPAIPPPPPEQSRQSRPDVVRPAAATIAISSRDWAEIRVDGRLLGTTPIRRASLTPGTHELVATNAPLGLRAVARFEASAGEHVHAIVDFRSSPPQIVINP